MRSMVEGHGSNRLLPKTQENFNVPLHHLRWFPSPFRGGTALDL